MFMQRKGILPYNETYHVEPKCSSPDYLKRMEIINVPYHTMNCDSTSETTLASTKTQFQEITRQRVLSTSKIRDVPITTEPAVYLPKTTDDALTRHILKSTPVIGDHHTTEPVVIPPKTMDDVPTQQLLKSTPVTGEQHIKGKIR
ncbi:uncharacterized protein [Magallana gigas]|uniref:uncharacterized protein n=1 Tax=Magallana gigas TaxID=29159 RepID=UPI0033414292